MCRLGDVPVNVSVPPPRATLKRKADEVDDELLAKLSARYVAALS